MWVGVLGAACGPTREGAARSGATRLGRKAHHGDELWTNWGALSTQGGAKFEVQHKLTINRGRLSAHRAAGAWAMPATAAQARSAQSSTVTAGGPAFHTNCATDTPMSFPTFTALRKCTPA